MSNFNEVFKEEVFRLARKEIRRSMETLKKSNASLRSDVSQLRQRINDLEKQLNRAQKPSVAKVKVEGPRLRYSAKGLISMRKRLGISQTDMATLLEVSQNTIHNWEAEKTSPRRSQLVRIAELRGKGKREVTKLLQSDDTKEA